MNNENNEIEKELERPGKRIRSSYNNQNEDSAIDAAIDCLFEHESGLVVSNVAQATPRIEQEGSSPPSPIRPVCEAESITSSVVNDLMAVLCEQREEASTNENETNVRACTGDLVPNESIDRDITSVDTEVGENKPLFLALREIWREEQQKRSLEVGDACFSGVEFRSIEIGTLNPTVVHEEKVHMILSDMSNGTRVNDYHVVLACHCGMVLSGDNVVAALKQKHGINFLHHVLMTPNCSGEDSHLGYIRQVRELESTRNCVLGNLAKSEIIVKYCMETRVYQELRGNFSGKRHKKIPEEVKSECLKISNKSSKEWTRYLRIASKLLAADCVSIGSYYEDKTRLDSQLKVSNDSIKLHKYCASNGKTYPLELFQQYVAYFVLLGSLHKGVHKRRHLQFFQYQGSGENLYKLLHGVNPEEFQHWKTLFQKALYLVPPEAIEDMSPVAGNEATVTGSGSRRRRVQTYDCFTGEINWALKTRQELWDEFIKEEYEGNKDRVTVTKEQLNYLIKGNASASTST